MRPLATTFQAPQSPQLLGTPGNSRTQPKRNLSTNTNEISKIKGDPLGSVNASNSSIESELKRIEALLIGDSKAFLQDFGRDFGANFGRAEEARETSGFNTASFNSRENSKVPSLTTTHPKMPALYEMTTDDSANKDSNGFYNQYPSTYQSDEHNQYMEQSSQDIQEQINPYYHPSQADSNNYDQYREPQPEQRLPTSPRSDHQEEDTESESTFEVKKLPLLGVRNFQPNKKPIPMPSLFDFPCIRPNSDKPKQMPPLKTKKQAEMYYNIEESSGASSPTDSRKRKSSPFKLLERNKTSVQSISPEIETFDIDYYLKHLMVPRRMKISIGGVPFQEVIFVLALKFFDKSSYFENFVFEWLDVKSSSMIGYIKCDFIKYVHKQAQKRFNVACREPRGGDNGEETLHYVHIEADTPARCELYVNGLNNVIKYMERSLRSLEN